MKYWLRDWFEDLALWFKMYSWVRRKSFYELQTMERTFAQNGVGSNLPCGSDCLYLIGGKDGRTLAALDGVEDRPLSRDDDR
jgi:hypothetical protein